MTRRSVNVRINGVGTLLLGLLTIAFVVLRLTGVITWSWWLVLLPVWGPVALWLAFVVLFVGLFALARGPFTRKGR